MGVGVGRGAGMSVDGCIAVAVGAGVTDETAGDTGTVGTAGAPVSMAVEIASAVGVIDDPLQADRASNSVAANDFMADCLPWANTPEIRFLPHPDTICGAVKISSAAVSRSLVFGPPGPGNF